MKRRDGVLLLLLEALVLGAVAFFQHSPGYMDADYYTLMGRQVAHGTTAEPFLWNYLDDPRGLPHPGFAYWQPLAAWVAAGGMRLAGSDGFAAARWPFFALALLVPPLTALLAFRLTRERTLALLSGALAVASGFYLPYLAVPDVFTPLMVLGALFFLVLGWPEGGQPLSPGGEGGQAGGEGQRRRLAFWQPWVLGALAGLMHLARAEGFLWLLAAWGGLALARRNARARYLFTLSREKPQIPQKNIHRLHRLAKIGQNTLKSPTLTSVSWRPWRSLGGLGGLKIRGHPFYPRGSRPIFPRLNSYRAGLAALLGYAMVMAPWFWRNGVAFGTPLAPGGWRTLWLTQYDELYIYPAAKLTLAHWWASGWQAIVEARVHAAATNLVSALAVQGAVVWLPLAAAGMWQRRKDRRVLVGGGMWLALWLVMSVVFPFSGARGGFFHAGAALQPLLWALAPAGLAVVLRPAARRRGWRAGEALRVLGWGLVASAVLLSGLVVQRRVVGANPAKPRWDAAARAYARIGAALTALGVPADARVLVNNPPGFTWATGRAALAVPYGDAGVVAAVARRYGAPYWLLEANHPRPLERLYRRPQSAPPPWRFAGMAGPATPLLVLEGAP